MTEQYDDEVTDVAVREKPSAIDRPVTDPAVRREVVDELEAQVLLIREAMERTLIKGVHYGTIPGTPRPSLWQPGAEMLCQMFRFQTDLTRTGEYEDWDKGIFSYTYKCRLVNRNGELITEREGTCSSKEPNYASKNAFQIRETLMQMAQKRAYVAAVRGAGTASAIFSQDDDIVPEGNGNSHDSGHGICPDHGVAYFQSGKMRSPAHKMMVNGKTEWCNKQEYDPGDRDALAEARIKPLKTASERGAYNGPKPGSGAGGHCPEHNMPWLKNSSGRFAHPIKEGNKLIGWCNQDEAMGGSAVEDAAALDAQAEAHLGDYDGPELDGMPEPEEAQDEVNH